jgi:hypothetical protein
MLSLRFDPTHEWWAPGSVVERLFQRALASRHLAPALEEWQHVADANGGLAFADLEPEVARDLRAGLRAAAIAELARLGEIDRESDEGTYKAALERLVAVTGTEPT